MTLKKKISQVIIDQNDCKMFLGANIAYFQGKQTNKVIQSVWLKIS